LHNLVKKGDRLHRRYHLVPGRGSARLRTRGCSALFLTFAVVGLVGCGAQPFHLDLLSANGRDAGGAVPSYDSLMRIGAAAQGGGDLVNALGVYRRAAEMAPLNPAPLSAAGDVLLEMGSVNEAIVSYNNALLRDQQYLPALVGLTRADLKTGKPALAMEPLSKAYALSPDDPKVLLLLGVTKDLAGEHGEAQAWYRRGLAATPSDPALTVNLALSLALSGDYATAVTTLQPVAMAPGGSPQERQTLALIYGLRGNLAEAARLNRLDLDDASVEHNLAYYATLRELSPQERTRALLSAGGSAAS
jgi:Flp pilus assembly protein TadD